MEFDYLHMYVWWLGEVKWRVELKGSNTFTHLVVWLAIKEPRPQLLAHLTRRMSTTSWKGMHVSRVISKSSICGCVILLLLLFTIFLLFINDNWKHNLKIKWIAYSSIILHCTTDCRHQNPALPDKPHTPIMPRGYTSHHSFLMLCCACMLCWITPVGIQNQSCLHKHLFVCWDDLNHTLVRTQLYLYNISFYITSHSLYAL